MKEDPKDGPKPLTVPLPLILCCNKPPPGCGFCWYCVQRKPAPLVKPKRRL